MLSIETERTIIRPIAQGDNKAIFDYRADALANKFQSWIPGSLDEVDKFISKNPKEFNVADTWFQVVVILKESDQLIGDIGIHFIDAQQCELGITFRKDKQGIGLATESMDAIIEYLFTALNKHRLVTSIDPQNLSAINLVKRLGFRKEGHFKESLFINGEWVDDVIFALLKKDRTYAL